jgi:hypothetical protein
MVGRTARRLWSDALKPQRPQIQLVDEHVDHPHRIVFSHVIVEELGEQNALRSVLALNKTLHQSPRSSSSQIIADSAFSHSLRPIATSPVGRRSFDLNHQK